MKNFLIWMGILGILGYVVLNYQVTQYHFYEGVTLEEMDSHLANKRGELQLTIDFLRRGAFSLTEGTGTVFEYAKLVKKATPNVNDDEIEAFTIYLPFDELESGDSKSFSPKTGVLVYYEGSKYRIPCYGYPTNGKVTVNSVGEIEMNVSISFVVDLLTTERKSCKTIEFNEEVTFKKSSIEDYWQGE